MERRLTGRHDSTLQAENGRLELMAESGSHGALLCQCRSVHRGTGRRGCQEEKRPAGGE